MFGAVGLDHALIAERDDMLLAKPEDLGGYPCREMASSEKLGHSNYKVTRIWGGAI